MHRRVLIVGTVPYNRQMTSRAFDAYFHNWERENLRQIFSHPRTPVRGHCGELYQITDKMLLRRRLFRKEPIGRIYHYDELEKDAVFGGDADSSSLISKLYKLGSRKSPLNYLLRGWLWKKKYWCTDQLNAWMDEFQPECIFLAFSDDFFIPQIALYAAERYKIPIVSCIGDDYYFNDRFSLSPFYHLYRRRYKKLINKVFSHGGSAAYIGDKIRDKYNAEFHLRGETVYLVSEVERQPFRPIRTEYPKIVYCGNIRLGRDQSLADISRALREIEPSYSLTVYSNENDKKYYRLLQESPGIDYKGTVPYEQVKKELTDCDITVVVEGFDKKDVDITRYSLSTKVADSLASGRFVLGYGSIECGAIEYLRKIECGLTCCSVDELRRELPVILESVELQKKAYDRATRISEAHHSLKRSTSVFEGIVETALSDYEDKYAER